MLFLAPAELHALDPRSLEGLLGRTDAVVAFGAGDVRGVAAAALLFADYAVLEGSATLVVDTPESWAGAVWRLGRKALAWHLAGADPAGIVDERSDESPEAWRERWMRGRSELALDSAAGLIRVRGGDRLERAEFARLFAAGEPQHGLTAFLTKRGPDFAAVRK
jgi:hypothetical protein